MITRRQFLEMSIATAVAAARPRPKPGVPVIQVNGAMQTGASLHTHGWAHGERLESGDVFVIHGSQSLNQVTNQPTGMLQTFVVTATATSDARGWMDIPIAPPIRTLGEHRTLVESPANNAIVQALNLPTIDQSDMSVAMSPLRVLRRLAPGEPDDRDSLAWWEWAKEYYVNAPMRQERS